MHQIRTETVEAYPEIAQGRRRVDGPGGGMKPAANSFRDVAAPNRVKCSVSIPFRRRVHGQQRRPDGPSAAAWLGEDAGPASLSGSPSRAVSQAKPARCRLGPAQDPPAEAQHHVQLAAQRRGAETPPEARSGQAASPPWSPWRRTHHPPPGPRACGKREPEGMALYGVEVARPAQLGTALPQKWVIVASAT